MRVAIENKNRETKMKTLTKKLIQTTIIIIPILSLQGCLVTAVGAGVGAALWGSSKSKDAQTKCHDSYNEYLQVEKKNNEIPMTIEKYCP